ncbi:hypothetical protein QP027_10420 [Corynebacterium breve]|uniref:Alpha/beta hydrolase n=1 Tax=Corynebacterium breve TaxID=3049799 RepID=A0ABY8VCX5_9CORY|nr:hypothetical protein [Corynebacterium breve]WIM67501.1 hypothetical protein QP027_10420 [Corynebacterium breve]
MVSFLSRFQLFSLLFAFGIPFFGPPAAETPVESPEPVQAVSPTPTNRVDTFSAHGLSSPYRLYAEDVDFNKPVRLIVRLHGDGAYEYDDPSYRLDDYAAIAKKHNAVLVAPRTPDYAGHPTWWENSSVNASWLESLVTDELLPEFGLAVEDVVWSGYSGGAEILGATIIPSYPELAQNQVVMKGGGNAPAETSLRDEANEPDTVGTLYFVTGANDDGSQFNQRFNALEAAQSGAEFYRQRGYDVIEEYPNGVDHYSLDQAAILDRALSSSR